MYSALGKECDQQEDKYYLVEKKWPNNLPPLPLPCLHTTVLLLSRFGYVLPQGSRSRPREMISSFVNGTPHSPPLSPLSLMYTSLGRPSFPMLYCNVHDAGHNLQGNFWSHISSLWKEKTFSYFGASLGRLNYTWDLYGHFSTSMAFNYNYTEGYGEGCVTTLLNVADST